MSRSSGQTYGEQTTLALKNLSGIVVASLATPDTLIEIEAVARVPAAS
jgi:hypothetical protein